MLTDLTDLSSCAAIGERLLKLWFEELDSLDQCPDVCTLNYMIDDLARMTAVHKSLLHMTVLANKLSTPTTPLATTTPAALGTPISRSATPADSNSTTLISTSSAAPGTPISRSALSPSIAFPRFESFSADSPDLPDLPFAIHDPRSTVDKTRSTTYRAPSIRETGMLRDIPMLRDLTPDQIRVELDRMIPYLEERHAEFHIGETDEPVPPADDLSEDCSDDSSDDFAEDFFEEEIAEEIAPDSPLTDDLSPNSGLSTQDSGLPRNRSR